MKIGTGLYSRVVAARGNDYGLDGTPEGNWLDRVPAGVQYAEEEGFDFVSTGETNHDSLLAMAVAASHSQRVELQTSVTIAFPRPPMVMAMAAWDIQQLSKGRFYLGLGSQVKAHNERRFSAPWTGPAATRMKEYIRLMHLIWNVFQTGERADFTGKFYKFNLMTPHFTPGPMPYGRPKVLLAVVGGAMARAAGDVADGVLPHGFMTDRYMREVVLENVRIGLERSGRSWDDVEISGGGFTAFGANQSEIEQNAERLRAPISYYGSTPAYFDVWRVHGWEELGQRLHLLSREQKWEEMRMLISDEVLEEFAQTSTYDDLPKFVANHREYASRLSLSMPRNTPADRERADHIMKEVRAVMGGRPHSTGPAK